MAPGPGDVLALARASWRPERPDRLVRALVAAAGAGPTIVGGIAAATARYPRAPAVIDDRGAVTYRQLWAASDAVAIHLRARGVAPGTAVGLLARNHRGFVIAMLAAAKLGADLVFLNTGFAGPQMADVVRSEGIGTLVYDDELADAAAACDVAAALARRELDDVAARPTREHVVPVRRDGRWVILTSGTTGRPKGAERRGAGAAGGVAPLLSTIPIRSRDHVVIAAPLFHAWGLVHLGTTLALSSTAVLAPQFDPTATLAAVADRRAAGLVVVPVMLQRILALDGPTLARHDTGSLRYIASSGSALGAGLATAARRRFGPVLYNVYGSTEAALATVATPADLLAAPATAGRPVSGTTVRILDDADRPLPAPAVGRVFVGSRSRFEGYTDGATKPTVAGLVATGDLGHFDEQGRLFIVGRDDDMIVSGGENVFPAEVEDCLAEHPGVVEAAVVGVPDEQFGQRLHAFVVRAPGASVTAETLRRHVRTRLARFKVPARVTFVDALPRTTTGKLRRRDL